MSSTLFEPETLRGATFSDGRVYRYSLFRRWGNADRMVNFLMLNPSTADAETNDPTIERCERRTRKLGYGGLVVTNLFAFRATDPKDMLRAYEPVGPDNDDAILEHANRAALIICGWGKDGVHRGRAYAVCKLLERYDLHALRISDKTGQPWHPLYVGYDVLPSTFSAAKPRRSNP